MSTRPKAAPVPLVLRHFKHVSLKKSRGANDPRLKEFLEGPASFANHLLRLLRSRKEPRTSLAGGVPARLDGLSRRVLINTRQLSLADDVCFTPIADMRRPAERVCYAPLADIAAVRRTSDPDLDTRRIASTAFPSVSPNAHAGRSVVVQRFFGFRQRRILWADRRAIGPVRRTDGYITRIATKPASELRIADDDERPGLRNLVEIGDAFGLRIALMQHPAFPLHIRGRVRVERLMPLKQALARLAQDLESSDERGV